MFESLCNLILIQSFHSQIHIHAHIHTHVSVCMCVCLYLCVHVCMYVWWNSLYSYRERTESKIRIQNRTLNNVWCEMCIYLTPASKHLLCVCILERRQMFSRNYKFVMNWLQLCFQDLFWKRLLLFWLKLDSLVTGPSAIVTRKSKVHTQIQ